MRADADIRDRIQTVMLYVFGPDYANTMIDALEKMPVPSKFELSKARFKVDAAYMLFMRHLDRTSGPASQINIKARLQSSVPP